MMPKAGSQVERDSSLMFILYAVPVNADVWGETYSVLAKGMEPYLHTACANLAVIEALAELCTSSTIDKARWGSDTSFRILRLSASCATLKPCHSGVCSIRVPAGRQCKYIEMGNSVRQVLE